jgi:hypothetical protein
MFQAIFHGKVRDNPAGVELGREWRSFYRQTEDFLTAAVFGRLTYLPSHTLWSILRHAAITVASSHPLPQDVGWLVTREFWPRWELDMPTQKTMRKEPDVFLGFERLHLLVEAKRGDFLTQDAEQWAADLAAFLQQEESDHAIPVWLLAIGGIGVLVEHALWLSAPDLRGIREESMVTMGEIVDGQSHG